MAEETLDQYKKRVASSGGKSNVAKHGRKHMAEIGKKGLRKRWKKPGLLKKLLFE